MNISSLLHLGLAAVLLATSCNQQAPPSLGINRPGLVGAAVITPVDIDARGSWKELAGPPIESFGFIWGEELPLDLQRDNRVVLGGTPRLDEEYQLIVSDLKIGTDYHFAIFWKEETGNSFIGETNTLSTVPDPCGNQASKPDLTSRLNAAQGRFLSLGDTLNLWVSTGNRSDDACFFTQTAPSSQTSLVVEFRPEQSSPFDTLQHFLVPIDSLPSQEAQADTFSFLFTQLGQYQITAWADTEQLINERAEHNNQSLLFFTLED